MIDEWRRAGVEVMFLNRPLGQSPEDDLLLQVQGIVAEYERAKIMERSRRGKKHAAQRGFLNVMSGAPFGYRYVTVHEGGGQARFELIPEQTRIVKQVFEWIALERCSLSEVCRRLQQAGDRTKTGMSVWSRPAVWHIVQNPAYYGMAAFGKTRMTERSKSARLRPARGRPAQHRRSNVPKAVDQKDWVFVTVPPLIEPALYRAAHRQLEHNRARARIGRKRAGYLLQGLLACSECRYAYYGKTVNQKGAGGLFRDFVYYRCAGTDGYRFGGERVCNNPQITAQFIETAVWSEVCTLLKNPQRLAQAHQLEAAADRSTEHPEILKAQLTKLQRGLERLIDTYSEGAIDKEQFTPRLSRTKARIAELEARIRANAEGVARQQELEFFVDHFQKLATHLGAVLENADWDRRREVIRSVVERVDIGLTEIAVLFRVPQGKAISNTDPVLVTFPRRDQKFRRLV